MNIFRKIGKTKKHILLGSKSVINCSPRAEFVMDEDRRAMRIRLPVHRAILEENNEVIENAEKR